MIDFSRANNSIKINDDGDDGIRIRVTSCLPLNVVGRLGVWGIRIQANKFPLCQRLAFEVDNDDDDNDDDYDGDDDDDDHEAEDADDDRSC